MAISFIADDEDNKILQSVQERFEVTVTDLPEEIDISTYSKLPDGWLYNNLLKNFSQLKDDNRERRIEDTTLE